MSFKMIFASAAALAMAAGTPAFAAKGSGQPSADAGGYKAKAERKKCKTFENSAMRTKRERLCLTAAEWKKFEAAQ